MRMNSRSKTGFAVLLVLGLPAVVSAQETLIQQCNAQISNDQTRRFCHLVVEAIEIGQPRVGITLAGGNPVPGASSTLGMRLGAVPRVSVGARATAVRLELPPIASQGSTAEIDAFVPSINIDASLGVFSGFSLLPTVGGFGSLDLVGSFGVIPIPEGEGFSGDSPKGWGIGARLGILRESFTAPGISITGMYRRLSDFNYGDRTLAGSQDSYFEASAMRVLSLRGVIGKRILVLGATAGIGYDKFKSDIAFGVDNPSLLGPPRFDFSESDFANDRTTAFASLQWTLLVLSIIGEVGYQSGGDDFPGDLPSGRTSTSDKSAYYGSLAIRLAI
jgi:hypothetical protein